MSATLGGLIKDLRLQKNLSQLEISLSLGWKESSRLSRIEQGKQKRPNRQLLDHLMNAMKLAPEERHRLYIAGGYLPTTAEINVARQQLSHLLESWPFPATSMDFAWRIMYSNQRLYQLYSVTPSHQKKLEKSLPHLLEIMFSPALIGDQPDTSFYLRLLAHFRQAQQARSNDHWYLKLVQQLMENPLFRELWPQSQQYQSEGYDVLNFSQKSIAGLEFYNLVLPVYNDARFMVEYYLPANLKTHKQYTL